MAVVFFPAYGAKGQESAQLDADVRGLEQEGNDLAVIDQPS